MTAPDAPASRVPSRAALGMRALVLLALALVFPLLVRNWSDNAYIFFPLAAVAFFVLSIPFAVAMLLPEGTPRIVGAGIAVALVWIIGGLCIVVLALSLIPAATQYRTNDVLISHLIGLALLLPVVIGIGWRLHR